MAGIKDWSTTAANNDDADSDINWLENQAPSSVNNSARAMMAKVRSWYEDVEWRDFGHTVTRTGNTTFTIGGGVDLTSTYAINRQIRCSDSSTLYGYISNSSYAAPTNTITVTLDSGNLSASLTAVALGVTPSQKSIPVAAVRNAVSAVDSNTFTAKQTFSAGIDLSGSAINFAEGSDVTSAATCDIWATTGNTVHVTGSTGPITSFGTAPQAGAMRFVIFDSTPTITHGANLNLPGAANITAAAGDSCLVYADTTTQLDVLVYTKADGTAVVAPTASQGLSLVYISSQTASNSAALTFTSGITSTYDKYILDIVDLLPATDNIDIWFEVSENAGSSWVTSNSYAWVYDDTGSNAGSNATANWAIALGVDNTSDYGGISGTVEIFNPAGSKYKKGKCDISSNGNTNTQEYLAGYGIYRSTSAVNGFRIKAASGNLTSGVIHMYGVKKS